VRTTNASSGNSPLDARRFDIPSDDRFLAGVSNTFADRHEELQSFTDFFVAITAGCDEHALIELHDKNRVAANDTAPCPIDTPV